VGACNVLPAGQLEAPGGENEGAGDAMAVVEMLVPVRARSPTAAVTIVPFRTRCCLSLSEIRTNFSSRRVGFRISGRREPKGGGLRGR
jgi:hypothetical protein